MPAVLREDTPATPTERKGALRVRIEAAIAARAERGALRAAIVRAGDFFGGEAGGGWFDQAIVSRLRRGRLVYPGPLDIEHAWAYLPDLGRALVCVAEADARLARLEQFHFGGHAATGAAFMEALAAAARDVGWTLPAPPRIDRMPWRALRVAGLVVPAWRETCEMRYLWQVPHRLDGSRMEAAVGPLPVTPLRPALAASLVALRLVPPHAARARAAAIDAA